MAQARTLSVICFKMVVNDRTPILVGWSIQRQQHGEQPYWMCAVIAAMVGQIGLPGGGISYGHHYSIRCIFDWLRCARFFPLNIDQGQSPKYTNTDYNGYSRMIPVARWVDSLLEPGKKIKANSFYCDATEISR
ncbi:molybdopterin-dependent oxidoreductase [Vibrio lentus]|nr:molybdopterin-dependent oxidoreductase [Vibrio lentus]